MRILLLTTFFPPANTIAAHRMYSFAEYLPEFGIDVTVVTVSRPGSLAKVPSKASVIHLYEDTVPINRFVPKASKFRKLLHYTGIRPLRNYYAGKYAKSFVRHSRQQRIGHIDAVLASYGPEDVLRAAEWLHDQHGIPLVLDFRDPWLGNRYYAWKPVENALIKQIQKRLLRKARLVTTVSKTLAKSLTDESGVNKVAVVYNGYYQEETATNALQTGREDAGNSLTVCYCGSLYAGIQPIDVFLDALKRVPRVYLKLALLDTVDVTVVRELAQRLGVQDRIEIFKSLSHESSLRLQRESDILLFLNRTDGSAKGVLTGKLFEYFSTGNFILGIGHPEDEAAELVQTYRNGAYVNSATQAAKVLERFEEFIKKPADMSFFTRRNQAQRLAQFIHAALQ